MNYRAGIKQIQEEYLLSDKTIALVDKHLALVLEANKTTNVTRITDPDEAQMLHIEDSLIGLPEVLAAPEGKMADMGSGAGFPGIPLAIVTGRNTVLIESVGKKAALLESFATELEISDRVKVFSGRLEDYAKEARASFAVITARALAQTSILMELAAPLLAPHGQLICYKAKPTDEELQHAKSLEKTLGMKIVNIRKTQLSDGETERCIITIEKVGKPEIKLPRRIGMAQKKPL